MRPESADRDRVYLADILESARLAISYLEDLDLETFQKDTQLQDAVIRRIEVIGEGARRVSGVGRNCPGERWSTSETS